MMNHRQRGEELDLFEQEIKDDKMVKTVSKGIAAFKKLRMAKNKFCLDHTKKTQELLAGKTNANRKKKRGSAEIHGVFGFLKTLKDNLE